MVNVDPLELVKNTELRCFGEVYKEKLLRDIRVLLMC